MKKWLVLFALLGALLFYLNKERPEWFLEALTRMPFIDTSMRVDFYEMDTAMTEESMHERYHNLYLVCDNEYSGLGDRVCWTHISTFNDIPADLVALFFKEGEYRHLRVTFPDEVHPQLIAYLNENYRFSATSMGSQEKFGQELGIWFTTEGTISAYFETPEPGNLNMLLWNNKRVYTGNLAR
jgi:hypothetical protein